MKKLISIVMLALAATCLAADAPKIAGKWDFLLETPHGSRPGVLALQQDGEKVSGNCEVERHGTSVVTGSIQGQNISMKIELHGQPLALIGTVEGGKMSGTGPAGATWKATRK